MDSTRSDIRRPGRRTASLVTAVLTLGATLFLPAPATAAVSPPHAPVGPFLRSSGLTSPQPCSSGSRVSRSLTPILGVSKGTPAYNADRPNLAATFEVASLGQSLVSATVAFDASLATYQVPAGVLGEGTYQFRVRAVDGGTVSEWLPWCTFTVQTVNVPAPRVPTSLRVSADPYAGFQFCGTTSVPVISSEGGPTFAASPGTYISNPNLVGRFEIARPGRESLIQVGNLYGVGVPAQSFTPGTYQFRVRAEDGNAVSAWSPWCDFVAQ
ncbi:hypothetical protein GCM10022251_22960 [Phytohabitans flavus]|uniref:hypothetical protein n=1 Tax=Phytohabitans flavus TaxID=1076124 RepID=UPI0031EADB16